MSTTALAILIIVLVAAIVAVLANLRSGPRVTQIDRVVRTKRKDSDDA
jgi:hypothetical protein